MENQISLNLSQGKSKKKSAQGSHISSYVLAVGDDTIVDYTIEEEDKHYNYNVVLKSGDVFLITSDVKSMTLGVSEALKGTKPKELVLNEGSLFMLAERE